VCVLSWNYHFSLVLQMRDSATASFVLAQPTLAANSVHDAHELVALEHPTLPGNLVSTFEVAPGSVFFDIISRVFNGRPFDQQHGFGKHMLEEDDALKVTIENDPTAGAFDDGSATYTSLRFSAEADWALLRALVIALVAIVFSTLFYIAARKSRVLRKHVFAPMVAEGAGGPDAFPGVCGWWAEVRTRIAEVVEPQLGLESKMVLRYVWFNVRLLAWASLCALMMIPAYELGAASDTWWILEAYKLDCDGHPDASGCIHSWSVLESATISHVPTGSVRLLASGAAAFVFCCAYCVELTFEWRKYARDRLRWHQRPGIEKQAVILRVEGETEAHADEVRRPRRSRADHGITSPRPPSLAPPPPYTLLRRRTEQRLAHTLPSPPIPSPPHRWPSRSGA